MAKEVRDITSARSLESHSHAETIAALVAEADTILLLGSCDARLGEVLELRNSSLTAIVPDEATADEARAHCESVVVADLDTAALQFTHDKAFDAIVLDASAPDLRRPWNLLGSLRDLLAPSGAIVAILPNIRHGSVRLNMLRGMLELDAGGQVGVYGFTIKSIQDAFISAGYRISQIERIRRSIFGTFDDAPGLSRAEFPKEIVQQIEAEVDSDTRFFVVKALPIDDMQKERELVHRARAAESELATAKYFVERQHSEIEAIRFAIAETEQRLATLEGRFVDASSATEKEKEESRERTAFLEQLNVQLQSAITSAASAAAVRLDEIQRRLTFAENQAQQYRADVESGRESLAHHLAVAEEARAAAAETAQQNVQLQSAMTSAASAAAVRLDEIQRRLTFAENQAQRYRADAQSGRESLAHHLAVAEEARAAAAETAQQIDKLRSRLVSAEQLVEAYQSEIFSEKSKSLEQKLAFDQTARTAELRFDQLRERLADAQLRVRDYEANLEDERATSAARSVELQRQIDELSHNVHDLQGLSGRLAQERDAERHKAEQIGLDFEAKLLSERALSSQLRSALEAAARGADLRLDAAQQQLSEVQRIVDTYRFERDAEHDMVATLQQQICEKQAHLDQSEANANQSQRLLSVERETVHSLRAALESAARSAELRLDEMERRLRRTRESAESHSVIASQLQAEVQNARATAKHVEQELRAALEATSKTAELRLDDLQLRLAKAEDRLAKAAAQSAQTESRLSRAETERDNAKKDAAEVQNLLKEARQQTSNFSAEVVILKVRAARAENELELQRTASNTARSALIEAESTIAVLQRELLDQTNTMITAVQAESTRLSLLIETVQSSKFWKIKRWFNRLRGR